MLQIRSNSADAVLGQLDQGRSGLVLSGRGAVKKAAGLRYQGYAGTILVDPAVYEGAYASEDAPFPEVDSDTLAFGDPLGQAVFDQTAARASAVLTPTGYIRAEDSGALKAAVNAVLALDDPRLVLTVPIDVMWLSDETLPQLIRWLSKVPNPKAVILGGQKDPLGRFKQAVPNLCTLMREVPSAGLLRTDLAAFGAMAQGADFTAFGASSSLRHTVPPDEPAERSPFNAKSPHVLFPELMRFFLGSTIASKFAAKPAPVCQCAACGGRPLDAYPDRTNPRTGMASAHNVAVLMEWQRTLSAIEPGPAQALWWKQRCQEALARYDLVNAAIDQPRAFKPDAQLTRWADLDLDG